MIGIGHKTWIYERGEFKIKCDWQNNTKTVAYMYIQMCFLNFSAWTLPIRKHFAKGSYHRRKAAANLSLMMICWTPSKVIFIPSWVSLRTKGKSFSSGNRPLTAVDRSSECSLFLILWLASNFSPSAAVGTGTSNPALPSKASSA